MGTFAHTETERSATARGRLGASGSFGGDVWIVPGPSTPKLYVPQQGHILPRPRLRAAVRSLWGGGVATLVAGPGYGKTATMADMLSTPAALIGSLGPSSIQPVVAARRLPARLKADLREALLAMGDDPAARAVLDFALVERFAPVEDAGYDDIRGMLQGFKEAGFTTLR